MTAVESLFGAATRKEQALRLLEDLVPGGVNNLPVVLRVDGRIDRTAITAAVTAAVRRHPVLRTGFPTRDAVMQRVVLAAEAVAVELEILPTSGPALEDDLAEFIRRPFPFDGGLMLRAGICPRPEGDVLCLVLHHLVFDTISGALLIDELTAAYDALVAGRAMPGGQAEIVPASQASAADIEFWRDHLAGFEPSGLELACGGPDRARPTLHGGRISYAMSSDVRGMLDQVRTQLRAPEAVVLLAAYYLLLARHGAGPDLVVGSPINVRPAEARSAIGYHVNVVPLRVRVEPSASFRDLVRLTRDVFFEAIAHADAPVEQVMDELNAPGASWRNTVFRHVFNYVPDIGLGERAFGGMPTRPVLVENGYSKFDLEFFLVSSAAELTIRAVYYDEILSVADVAALLRRYETILAAVLADPDLPVGDVPLFTDEDHAVIGKANATASLSTPSDLLTAVADRVRANPDAAAVEDGARTVTYQQLWDQAAATRDALRDKGIGPGAVVGVFAPRGADLAAAVLGVLRAGAAYLPLDPVYPVARLAWQVTDAGCAAVLAPRGAAVLPDVPTVEIPLTGATGGTDSEPAARDCSLVVYTSGSTGRPKGARLTHGGLANVVAHFADMLGAGPGDGTLWLAGFGFDMSSMDLWLALSTGGRLVVAPDEARSNGQILLDLLSRHRIRFVQATPTTWRLVTNEITTGLAGLRVVSGGEPLPPDLAARLISAGARVWNGYGPTETTIYATCREVGADETAPLDVGTPIRGTHVFVADPAGRPLPVGVRGELCIAGAGVAQGYQARPDLTAERFGVHTEYGRFYRTGDIARWRSDGTVELLGRADRQVKLRGVRIELGEIEAVLAEHPAVRAAAVTVDGEGADRVLVAFAESDGITHDELWTHASAHLPPSMVPNHFHVVAALARNNNEKVDYGALAATPGLRTIAAPPDDDLVIELIALWREQLERDDVDAETNFFAHGGHSLLAAQLVQQIEERRPSGLRLADLFTNPTPSALAAFLRAGPTADEPGAE
ncbi:amino acid adenylation domain-containing protein [Kibdelosporangium banguiense]|uniref:Amino acid adenylation domain-containing protein n=1 Tax=Kibdelosporangium banguiense TaxID=1365924 RepID=A0ABS4TW81_9PSEU|nr:amino acid adenylation domain-containing protein [Kibdelosporangium banguiense]MBP2328667.1 amino acid adenylation domain-containing protein [Kibdelosporangium banguiense]